MAPIILLHLRKSTTQILFEITYVLRISLYSTSATDHAAYIIGGYPGPIDTIAEFRNNQWSKVGTLSKARNHHGSIGVGELTMVIGGYAESGET